MRVLELYFDDDHGDKKKGCGIFSYKYDHERSTNDDDTNMVDPSMPRDT